MPYLYLALAIIGEVTGTSALKASQGFTQVLPSVIVVLGYAFSFFFLSLALKYLALGFSYAIWCGMGIILVALVGVVLYEERLDGPALLGIFLIISGIGVLNLFSGAAEQ
ncbi:DMT family transporter [Thiohalorhabdus sp. Cl-TMA]|uniref:Multidrug efflux SMR transporter n=1 Tax=Thiohalorhabdus methylotrophus TaxID=3242694 RepID=A0ABV4TV59_9GAMM